LVECDSLREIASNLIREAAKERSVEVRPFRFQ
jgi:hypothetical protein